MKALTLTGAQVMGEGAAETKINALVVAFAVGL